FDALWRTYRALDQAERNGAVFPISIDPTVGFQTPQLSAPTSRRGQPLLSWMPGRVEGVDPEGVHLHVAELPLDGPSDPMFGQLTMSLDEFNRWSVAERAQQLQAGRFVEVAVYGSADEKEVVIHIHRDHPD